MSDEADVLKAATNFYGALETLLSGGGTEAMRAAWHHTPRVTSAHPMGDWAYGWEEVQGRKVPVVLFRGRDHGFAKVYAFRSTQFNLKAVEEAQSSYCTAKPYPTRDGVSFLVVFTGRDLTQFTRGHNPGGPVAMAL